jgi:hypothetical protein
MSLTKVSYSMIDGASVNALDFGMDVTASAAVNKAALQAAIDSLPNGGEVYIPQGYYGVDPGVTVGDVNVTIRGAGNGRGYGGSSVTYVGTRLLFNSAGTGITVNSLNCGPCIKDLALFGNGNGTDGIFLVGTNTILDGVATSGFTNCGFWLRSGINMVQLNNCSGIGNGYGMRVGSDTLGGNTIFKVSGCVFRQNNIGVRVDQAVNYAFYDTVSESNTAEGLVLYQHTGVQHAELTFTNCWFENNNAGTPTGYQIVVDGAAGAGPYIGNFYNCTVQALGGAVRAVKIARGIEISFWYCAFSSVSTPSDIVLEATALNCTFGYRNGGGITDNGQFNNTVGAGNCGGPVWSKGIGVGGGDASGALTGVAFPAVYLPSSNKNCFDDYDEYLSSGGACTGATTAAPSLAWRLTKAGNLVTLFVPALNGAAAAATPYYEYAVAIPDKYLPFTALGFPVQVIDNGAAILSNGIAGLGIIYIGAAAGSKIRVYRSGDYTTNFTNANTLGIGTAICVSWVV